MTPLFRVTASVVCTLAVALPVDAQGKGKSHKSTPPGNTALPSPMVAAPATAGTLPFAWIDDASMLPPGSVSLAISTQF